MDFIVRYGFILARLKIEQRDRGNIVSPQSNNLGPPPLPSHFLWRTQVVQGLRSQRLHGVCEGVEGLEGAQGAERERRGAEGAGAEGAKGAEGVAWVR
jgi:hypothetical protein